MTTPYIPDSVKIGQLIGRESAETITTMQSFCMRELILAENPDVTDWLMELIRASANQKSSTLGGCYIANPLNSLAITQPRLGLLLQMVLGITMYFNDDPWSSTWECLVDYDTFESYWIKLLSTVVHNNDLN